ncbi:MAG TPA: DUF5681 domain-containing protein [Stellaceae bacterium]|nr:DUF5681 domain-containing protein [Stellaceae bacterium]
MADNSMEEQQKQLGRVRERPFEEGQSGNPAGRPRGSRNSATLVTQLLLDGETQALTRKAVELALGGDTTALRMCLDRIAPPRRERVAPYKLPPARDAADLAGTMTAIMAATGDGAISPSAGSRMARLVNSRWAAPHLAALRVPPSTARGKSAGGAPPTRRGWPR